MKMMTMKMLALMSGMGIMGLLYLKKHPDKIHSMKEIGKEATRKMYNLLDEDN